MSGGGYNLRSRQVPAPIRAARKSWNFYHSTATFSKVPPPSNCEPHPIGLKAIRKRARKASLRSGSQPASARQSAVASVQPTVIQVPRRAAPRARTQPAPARQMTSAVASANTNLTMAVPVVPQPPTPSACAPGSPSYPLGFSCFSAILVLLTSLIITIYFVSC